MNKKLWRTSCLAAALGAMTAGQEANAQYTNSLASGNWTSAGTWDAGAPSDTNAAIVNNSHAITVNSSVFTNLLDIGTIAGQSGTVTVTGGELAITDDPLTEPNIPSIRVGQVAGASGELSISGGVVYIDGEKGSGFANGDLLIGDNGTGVVTVSGGSLTMQDELFVGLFGTGTLNASAGTVDVVGRNFLLGFGAAANGTLNLSGTAVINVAEFLFSSFDPGAVSAATQTGGTLNVGFAFVHGRNGNAVYNHSGGAINVLPGLNGDFVVGDGGTGSVYNISGTATLTNARDILVGVFAGAEGTVNQTGGTIQTAGLVRVGVDGNGTWNHSAGTTTVAGSIFLGDFDTSLGVYNISGGTLNISGNLNVGAALASNAPVTGRLEPSEANGPQGQALDANGTFNVIGKGGDVNVTGNLLANPRDKAAYRNATGQENDSILKFTLGTTGISTITIGGIADLDGAVIDIDDTANYFAANPAASLTLIDAAGGFGNVFTVTAAEAAGNGRGFALAPADASQYSLAIQASGGGEKLVLTKSGGGGLAADFNDDGFVNGADLGIWKTQFGQPSNGADANNDGKTDGADFLVWQRQFGAAPAAPVAAAVPEPTSGALVAVGLAGLAGLRRRK